MVTWRMRRQLFILGLLVVVLGGGAVLWGSRFLPDPSCKDNKHNQGEFGVDCGGPCAPCELKNPRQITTFWARAVPVRPGVFDVAALIENPNEKLAAAQVPYTFTLRDEFGPVAQRTGSTFILAQERAVVVETTLEVARAPTRVDFEIKGKSITWEVRRDIPQNVFAEKRSYRVVEEHGTKRSVVEASVVNTTPYDFREVFVTVTVFNEEGNLLGVSRIALERLVAGEHRSVRSVWPVALIGKVATTNIDVRVNPFSEDVIIRPE